MIATFSRNRLESEFYLGNFPISTKFCTYRNETRLQAFLQSLKDGRSQQGDRGEGPSDPMDLQRR